MNLGCCEILPTEVALETPGPWSALDWQPSAPIEVERAKYLGFHWIAAFSCLMQRMRLMLEVMGFPRYRFLKVSLVCYRQPAKLKSEDPYSRLDQLRRTHSPATLATAVQEAYLEGRYS